MDKNRTWYAVLEDEDSLDFSVGSYDDVEARMMCFKPPYDPDKARIAAVYWLDGYYHIQPYPCPASVEL